MIRLNSTSAILRRNEDVVLGLRSLYESYGYKKFKMRKFEKYDLYLENKSFLRNANIITVTDPAGHLLALKPDITLSIVKNIRAAKLPEKVYYNENIYFADSQAGEIKETTQVGLEYIGDIDVRAMGEILILAANSLEIADDNYRIAVSHMGIVSEILENASLHESEKKHITDLISDKNLHGLNEFCNKIEMSKENIDKISALVKISGNMKESISMARKLVCGDVSKNSLSELSALADILDAFGLGEKFILDFSVINDVSYYNGLVFQGFISGVPKAVLSGGRYDNLVRRFGCDASAAGFAVSIDLLSQFRYSKMEYDYDVLLLYSTQCAPEMVLQKQNEICKNGKTCIALSCEPEWLKVDTKILLSPDGSVK